MSKSNEKISEGSPYNKGREGTSDNGLLLYEFQSHFSYKCLYAKLEVLQNELNNDNRETLSFHKIAHHNINENGNGEKLSRNEGGHSRNIILNHIAFNDNNEDDNDSAANNNAIDNICIQNPIRTHQIINRNKLNKDDCMSISNNNNNDDDDDKKKEEKKKDIDRDKQINDKTNIQTRNKIVKSNKQIYSNNNKLNPKKKPSVLFNNKKKPTERTAISMARPQKINCNLDKVVEFKPNSRSQPPLTRLNYHHKKDVLFPFHSINSNNYTNSNAISKVIPPSLSSIKANSRVKHKPSSLNRSIKFNSLKQYIPKTSICNNKNISSSKPKEILSSIDNSKPTLPTQGAINSPCSIIKAPHQSPMTQIKNKKSRLPCNKKNSNNMNINITSVVSKGVESHTQEKQKNLNLKFRTHPSQQRNIFQLNINHQTKAIASIKGTSPNKNIQPITLLTKGSSSINNNNIGNDKCRPKKILSTNINITKLKTNVSNQPTIQNKTNKTAANNNNINSLIINSLSRNQRSSLESIENLNTQMQYKTKTSKEKDNKSSSNNRQKQHKGNNNISRDKIFYTLDNTNFNKVNSKSKQRQSNYNTNPNSEAVVNQQRAGIKQGKIRTDPKRQGNSNQKTNGPNKNNGIALSLIKTSERSYIKKSISKIIK